MMPFFCATKTRPSGENSTLVGWVSPLKTTWSWNPDGRTTVAASAFWNATSRPASRVTTNRTCLTERRTDTPVLPLGECDQRQAMLGSAGYHPVPAEPPCLVHPIGVFPYPGRVAGWLGT